MIRLTSKGKISLLIVLLICSLLIFGCGQNNTESPNTGGSNNEKQANSSAEPIKIGIIEPITGPIAASGIAVRDGALIYQDMINASGGINGRPIQLIVEDSANDPAMAASAANKLITRDNVVALIAAWGSSPTLAVIPIARENQVPMVAETASSYKVTDKNEQGNPWTFRVNYPTAMESAAFGDKLVKDLGFKKVHFLSVNNDWGKGAAEEFGKLVIDTGGEVAGSDFFEQPETDFSSILTRVKDSKADSIILTTDATQAALVVEQAYNLGIKLPILAPGASCSLFKIMELAGQEAAEGFMQTASYAGAFDPQMSANPEESEAFNAEWKKRGHPWMEILEGARGYDVLKSIAEAIRTLPSDNITREGVRDALTKVKVKGIIFGDISFGEWGNFINQNAAPVTVAGVKDGKPVILMPPSVPVPPAK